MQWEKMINVIRNRDSPSYLFIFGGRDSIIMSLLQMKFRGFEEAIKQSLNSAYCLPCYSPLDCLISLWLGCRATTLEDLILSTSLLLHSILTLGLIK